MYYEYNNIKIYYEKFYSANNKDILILPGWGDTRNTFYNIINYLKDRYNVYIIDYPSFGNSPIPSKDLTIYDYTILIKNFMNDLNINNPLIIAHSFGGRIACLLNGLYGVNIDKMIFMDTAGIKPRKSIYRFIKEKTYKLLKFLINKIFKKTKKEKIIKLRKLFGSSDYSNLPNNMLNTFKNIVNEDLKKYYQNINSKVLLIWGMLDDATPYKDALYMNKKIKNSELIVFEKGTHFTYLEYSYHINLIIDEFIKEKDA